MLEKKGNIRLFQQLLDNIYNFKQHGGPNIPFDVLALVTNGES